MSNHMFIAAGGIPDQHDTSYRREPWTCHLAATTTLINAGLNPPDEWLALRGRYANYVDMGSTAVDSLIAAIIQPASGDNLPLLRACALAEEVARSGDDNAINERIRAAILRELEALYAPAAKKNYTLAAARYNDAATAFASCATTCNVELPGDGLINASPPQRAAWIEAPALAADLDQALHPLFAGAALCDGVPPDVAFHTAASDLDTVEHQIALAAQPGRAHRRKVWAAWMKTSGRTGRWGALHELNVRLVAAPNPADITPYGKPVQPVAVTSREGKITHWDPHSGPLADVMPGYIPVQVGWIEERPSTAAIP